MIILNLKNLMKRKSAATGKKITYTDIEDATGISYATLSRINSTVGYNIKIDHIEKLCRYFGCTPNDLISIYDDPKAFTPNS